MGMCAGRPLPGTQPQHQRATLTGSGGESHQSLLCLVSGQTGVWASFPRARADSGVSGESV